MTAELKDILFGVSILEINGDRSVVISDLTFDSRKAKDGTLFFAIKGTNADGHNFVDQVVANGCKAIIASEKIETPNDVTVVYTNNTHEALAIISNNFYDEPSQELKIVGVTGTNGKTTITTLLHDLFQKMGYKTGLISTVVNKIGEEEIPSTHTTPDPISLQYLFRQMVDAGVEYCFMEVSSHAIDQHRVTAVNFAGGVFTNITHDHLDYHKTFKEYLNVKKRFFDNLPKSAFALTNTDDKNGEVMLQNTNAKKRSYAMKGIADYKVKVLENTFSGLVLNINGTEVWSKLIGDFNAYNLTAVYGVTQEMGIDKTDALTQLSLLDSVNGRFQYIKSDDDTTIIIDYAHTPDALANVLKTIENIRTKNETVFTVVGCGGDRDKTKRPEMAAIACQLSDKVIFTSDNPRSEDPEVIINDMMEGVDGSQFRKTLTIINREQAIKTALAMSQAKDIILIAGKGHETYQEIKGIKYDFDDFQITKELIQKLAK